MNSNRIASARSARNKRRESALARIEEFLKQDTEASNAEFIRLMRQSYFGDGDALQETGLVKLPQ
jgi:hypothetical protein